MANKMILLDSCLLLLVAVAAVVDAQPSSFAAADESLKTSYQAILAAYKAGADTNQLIDQLNQALNLTQKAQQLANADPQGAEALANQAQTIMQNVTEQATVAQQSASTMLPVSTILAGAISLAVGVGAYAVGPRVLWKIWFKIRKKRQVKIGNVGGNEKAIIITPQQVCAVVLGVTIIVAFIVVTPLFLPKNTGEQFSELGILGPNMKLGDYPSQVVASETVHLYVYVGNQMGQPMYYTVLVKLGNNGTQTNPANLTAIRQDQQVVSNNQTWTYPVDITLMTPGVNQRLIFELWAYNQTTNQVQYHERWGQIWLNVTAPAI